MPYTPVSFGVLAGASRAELFDPARPTPTHEWARAKRAVFEDVGQWKRAALFPACGRGHAARRRSRMHGGTPVGRPLRRLDARQDRDRRAGRRRIHEPHLHQPWTKLEPGRCRYGVMLREDGSSSMTASSGRLAPTASTSPPRPEARRGSSTTWRITCRPNGPDLDVLAHLDDRAMGGASRCRVRTRGGDRARSSRTSIFRLRPCRI